ncbi:MAG: hypothetical protein ACLPXZ_23580 [Mycobacterium sp.]
MTAQDTEQTSDSDEDTGQGRHREEDRATTPEEKPEPNEEDKKKAAEMMTAYEDRPTLVLPGTGGSVSGTAVNDWLDDDGNPKGAGDEDSPAANAKDALDKYGENDSEIEGIDDESIEDKTKRDKEFNAAVIKDAKERTSADS